MPDSPIPHSVGIEWIERQSLLVDDDLVSPIVRSRLKPSTDDAVSLSPPVVESEDLEIVVIKNRFKCKWEKWIIKFEF